MWQETRTPQVTVAGYAASSELKATQGSERLRLSTVGGMWRASSGSGGAQARPPAGRGGAGIDRGTKLRKQAGRRQVEGVKQPDSESDAHARQDARATRQWRQETRLGVRLTIRGRMQRLRPGGRGPPAPGAAA